MPKDVGGNPNPGETQQQRSEQGQPGDGNMAALGGLICDLNPYTGQTDPTTGLETGDMEVVMLPPASGYPNNTIGCMGVEIEQNYGTKWTFKGQEQSVKLAFRFAYRFPVKKNGKVLYWQTEHVIVGFAGAEGGG